MKKLKTQIKSKYKVGQNAVMKFHGFGMVSEEIHEITKVDGDYITLNTDEEASKRKVFDTATGECLNDTTDFGCHRSLKLD